MVGNILDKTCFSQLSLNAEEIIGYSLLLLQIDYVPDSSLSHPSPLLVLLGRTAGIRRVVGIGRVVGIRRMVKVRWVVGTRRRMVKVRWMAGTRKMAKSVLCPHAEPALDSLGTGTPQDTLFSSCLSTPFLAVHKGTMAMPHHFSSFHSDVESLRRALFLKMFLAGLKKQYLSVWQ